MGCRIHKILGYSLNDVKCDKNGHINDERFNLDELYAKNQDEQCFEKLFTRSDLLKYIEDHSQFKDLKFDIRPYQKDDNALLEKFYGSSVIKHNSEFGLKNVLMVTIPWNKDWHRYDDIMDYCESTDSKPSINTIWGNIYPYIGGNWINVKTKKEYTHSEFDPCLIYSYMNEKNSKLPKSYFESKFGTSNKKELKNILYSIPPDIIKLLCEYLNIFKDINTYKELKPSIYTYWS